MIVLPAVGRGVVAYNSEMMNFGYRSAQGGKVQADCPCIAAYIIMAGVLRILGKESQHTGHSCMRQVPPISAAVRAIGDRVVRGHSSCNRTARSSRSVQTRRRNVLTGNTGVIRNFIAPLPRMKLCSIGMSQPRTVFVSGLPHNDAAVYTGTALRGSSLYGRHANSMFPCPNKKRARLMCGTGPKTHVRQRNATTYLMLVCA